MDNKNAAYEKKVPWTIKDVVIALILVVVLIGVGSIVIGLALIRGKTLSLSALIITLILQYVVIFFTVYFIAIRKRGGSWSELGFRSFKFWGDLGIAVSALIGVEIIVAIYSLILNLFHVIRPPDRAMEAVSLFVKSGGSGLLLAIGIVAIVAPVMEEMFFRGFIYAALRKRLGVGLAILISSLLFAGFHLSLYDLVPLTIIGAALAYLYEKSDSLGPPIMLHSLNNLLSVILIYYSRNLPRV